MKDDNKPLYLKNKGKLILMKLMKIDADLLSRAKEEWLAFVADSDDLPETPYERSIAWAGMTHGQHYEIYAITNEEASPPKVLALLDIAHKLPNLPEHYTLKIMGIITAPHFDVRGRLTEKDNTFTRRNMLSKVAAAIVIHGIDLMFKLDAKELKIYASNLLTLELFELVAGQLDRALLDKVGLDVNTHGNWLVVKPTR